MYAIWCLCLLLHIIMLHKCIIGLINFHLWGNAGMLGMFTHRLQTHFFRRFSQVLVLLKVASSFGRRRYAFITNLPPFLLNGSPLLVILVHSFMLCSHPTVSWTTLIADQLLLLLWLLMEGICEKHFIACCVMCICFLFGCSYILICSLQVWAAYKS